MSIFVEEDYRAILKHKVRQAVKDGERLTWKKVAARIPVQYTYLSRALNHEGTHLNEDHLHEICKILNFFPDETEYLIALRGLAVATSQSRKDYLTKKLLSIRRSHDLNATKKQVGSVSGEVNFLLSPLTWVAYFALELKEFQENPRRLAQQLGIEMDQLRGLIQTLQDLSLIETDGSTMRVTKVKKNHFHYSMDHPLTQMSLQMLRPLCDSHFLRLPVAKRVRFMATFNADEPTYARIEELFRVFLKEVERVAVKAPSRKTYQLNFELFPWV